MLINETYWKYTINWPFLISNRIEQNAYGFYPMCIFLWVRAPVLLRTSDFIQLSSKKKCVVVVVRTWLVWNLVALLFCLPCLFGSQAKTQSHRNRATAYRLNGRVLCYGDYGVVGDEEWMASEWQFDAFGDMRYRNRALHASEWASVATTATNKNVTAARKTVRRTEEANELITKKKKWKRDDVRLCLLARSYTH